jgi:hypothetical protein
MGNIMIACGLIGAYVDTVSNSLSGTWRCMGATQGRAYGNATLFVRVS